MEQWNKGRVHSRNVGNVPTVDRPQWNLVSTTAGASGQPAQVFANVGQGQTGLNTGVPNYFTFQHCKQILHSYVKLLPTALFGFLNLDYLI